MAQSNLKSIIECQKCKFFSVCAPIRIGDRHYDLIGDALDKFRKVSRGTILFDEGSEVNSLFTVCKGVFKATTTDADGEERVVDFYMPGRSIGLESLSGTRARARVEALNSAAVCEIPLRRLALITREVPRIQTALMELLVDEVGHYQRVVGTLLGTHAAEEALAALLLHLSEAAAESGEFAETFDLPMTYAEMASYLGLTRETVTRLMARFKTNGVAAYRGRQIHIRNHEMLRALGTPGAAHRRGTQRQEF